MIEIDAGVSGWAAFHRRVSRLQPPLSPHRDVVDRLGEAIADDDGHVLLLGMTAALFHLGGTLTAVDWSAAMIAELWPGDRADRRALCGDWRELAAPRAPYTAVIGDGSFNVLPGLDQVAEVAARLTRIAPGAAVAVRCFITPDPAGAETVAELARAEALGGFHAFKWRLAMALCHERASARIAVEDIAEAFDHLFPDRAALARRSGWSQDTISEIDAYRGSDAVYVFPTRAELLSAIGNPPGARFVDSGDYELAERCPLLVWRLP